MILRTGRAAALAQQLERPAAGRTAPQPTRLRLTPTTGGSAQASSSPLVLTSTTKDEDSMFAASFPVPPSLASGDYTVEVSNGFGGDEAWVGMRSFLAANDTSSGTVTVKPPRQWTNGKAQIFNVSDYGCAGTIECDSTAAVRAALAAADSNGGGVVYFPRGQFFLMSTDDGIQLGPVSHTRQLVDVSRWAVVAHNALCCRA